MDGVEAGYANPAMQARISSVVRFLTPELDYKLL
jgi:hypothetical protein